MKTDNQTHYRTYKWDFDIDPVTAVKSTEKSIWIKVTLYDGKERLDRSAKHSEYASFWDTKEEAVKHLMRRAESQIETAEAKIKTANEAIKHLKTL